MSKEILIATQPGDFHAYAVAEALRCKGESPLVWHTSDFPHRATESVRFTGQTRSMRVAGPGLDLGDRRVDVVWNRRPDHRMDEEILHPADVDFADLSCWRSGARCSSSSARAGSGSTTIWRCGGAAS